MTKFDDRCELSGSSCNSVKTKKQVLGDLKFKEEPRVCSADPAPSPQVSYWRLKRLLGRSKQIFLDGNLASTTPAVHVLETGSKEKGTDKLEVTLDPRLGSPKGLAGIYLTKQGSAYGIASREDGRKLPVKISKEQTATLLSLIETYSPLKWTSELQDEIFAILGESGQRRIITKDETILIKSRPRTFALEVDIRSRLDENPKLTYQANFQVTRNGDKFNVEGLEHYNGDKKSPISESAAALIASYFLEKARD